MIKNKIRIILVLLLTWGFTPEMGRAQEAMSLKDCMTYALEHSAEHEILKLDQDDIRLGRRDAILEAFTPRIQGGVYAYSNFGRTVDPETNTYISTTSFNNGYQLGGSIYLFNGFSALDNIKIMKTKMKIGISEEARMKDKICLAVMEAYCNVAYHTQLAEVIDRQRKTAQENLELVTRQYELGQKSYPDVAQVEADLADREYQLVQTENRREDALLTLKSVMMWPVADTLPLDLSEIQAAALAVPQPEEGLSAQEIIDYALGHQSDVHIAEGRLQNAKRALHTAKWQFSPSLTLSGGWSTSFYMYPGQTTMRVPRFGDQWRNNSGEYIQLNLNIPIFSGLSRYSNLSRKKNDYQRAEAQYRQTLQEVESEVARAVQDRNGSMKAWEQAQKRTIAQGASYRLHQKKLQQGLVSPVELQTISNAYLNAQAEELNASLQYFLKRSVVRYYQGLGYMEQ